MADSITVEVKVHPILREFILSSTKSDIIRVSKNDFLAKKIKCQLIRPPKNYTPKHQYESTITIEIKDFYISDKRIYVNSQNHLDARSQKVIADELNTLFKSVFHNYVLAYVRGQGMKTGCQRLGILDFCDVYGLTFEKINYEMLKKSWDRSLQKKMIKEKNYSN